jgi:hypothetical protein
MLFITIIMIVMALEAIGFFSPFILYLQKPHFRYTHCLISCFSGEDSKYLMTHLLF